MFFSKTRIFVLAGLALIAALALFFNLYRKAEPKNSLVDTAPSNLCDKVPDISAYNKGEMAAVQIRKKPEALPQLMFKGPHDDAKELADFKGKVVLLNLWATWCAPCREEMPALDLLQKTLGGKDFGGENFQVVAVNIDTRNLDRPKVWLKEQGITNLTYYADPEAKIFQTLKRIGRATGMPTSLLIDQKGCELAILNGPANWASGDAIALVKAAINKQ